MRLNRILLFSAAIGCALLLMATRDTKQAAACSSLTFSATCTTGNPSFITIHGCNYDCSGAGGTVKIYNGCDANCNGCTYVTSFTTFNFLFCPGDIGGNTYNVNCASPNQGYVCAYDVDTGRWGPAHDVGSCQCTQAPT